jgi:hypothetical protein
MKTSNPSLRRIAWTMAIVGMTLSGQAQTITFTNIWSIGTGVRDYITTGTTERGIAVNPVTGHVLVVSRAGGLKIKILDGNTGAEIKDLDTFDVTSIGTFILSTIGVAADGVIYSANLTIDTTSAPLRVYRWINEDSAAEVIYEGAPAPGLRLGDSLDVRGAGLNTQIALGTANPAGSAATGRFVILTPTNDFGFKATVFSPSGVAAAALQKGITFGPTNTILGKINGSPAKFISFNLSNGESSLIRDVAINTSISPVDYDPTNNLLAGMNYVSHQLLIYDVSDFAAPLQVASFTFPTPATANGNGVGAVDFGPGRLLGLDTQNGVVAVRVDVSSEATPVSIAPDGQPLSQNVLEGATVSFSVGPTGSKPYFFQWYHDEKVITNATNAIFTLSPATPGDAGNYKVIVSNSLNSVESSNAILNVTALVRSGRLVKLWSKAVGDFPWLANDNNHRGLAYNPVSSNVVVISRSLGTTNVYVLDGQTGAFKHQLRATDANDVNLVFGGYFPLNMIDVADDGAVYACDLSLGGTDLIIYRWADDKPDTIPTLAYGPGDPNLVRCGDAIAVRGAGRNTQILVSGRNGTKVAVLTSADGLTFTPTTIDTPGATDGNFGLSVAFGEGDTFWGKATGTNAPLRHVAFNLASGVGTILHTFPSVPTEEFPSFVGVIGVDNNKKLLAGIALETPDNIRLYNITNLDAPPVLVHQELFPSDNPNLNGTGMVDFGNNRLYVLDSNNGIVAFEVKEGAPPAQRATLSNPVFAGSSFNFTLSGTVGATYRIQTSTTLTNWTDVNSYTIPSSGSLPVQVLTAGESRGFYQAVAP